MRTRIFEIVNNSDNESQYKNYYDAFMMVVIIVSIIPLAFIETNRFFDVIDKITVVVFIIDYLARLIVADKTLNRGAASFVIYPFTPMAIIDLISILPSVSVLNSGWRLLKIFRLLRTLRVLRVFKVIRYSSSIALFIKVFKKQKSALVTVFGVAISYILICALVILNVEPETFGDFFQAVYWATVSLTTVGYGDIYPTSVVGQVITILSSLVGIAVVSMPAGIITAGFMTELEKQKGENNNTTE